MEAGDNGINNNKKKEINNTEWKTYTETQSIITTIISK